VGVRIAVLHQRGDVDMTCAELAAIALALGAFYGLLIGWIMWKKDK
jgi:hypothetical protein